MPSNPLRSGFEAVSKLFHSLFQFAFENDQRGRSNARAPFALQLPPSRRIDRDRAAFPAQPLAFPRVFGGSRPFPAFPG